MLNYLLFIFKILNVLLLSEETYISYDVDIIRHVMEATISLTDDNLQDKDPKAVHIRFH